MSAYPVLDAVDRLAVALGIGTTGLDFTYDQLDAINDVLAAYAHELAEKLRREADELDGWPEAQHVMRKDADLIDPEVSE